RPKETPFKIVDFFKLKQPMSAAELVRQIDLTARILGDASQTFSGVSSLDHATPDALCFCALTSPDAESLIANSPAKVVICSEHFSPTEKISSKALILTANPMLYFTRMLKLFFPSPLKKGVASSAVVEPGAEIAADVSVDHFVVVQNGAKIESGCIIESGARILRGSVIRKNSRIGANSVIGAEGLAFGKESDGSYETMPHLGRAVLENDVWVGANSTVVKGILTDTIVGRGTKIGNHVNVGHNVKIGENCFIAAGSVLCGSSKIGDRVWLAAASVILNKINVGADALVGIGAVVSKDVAPGNHVMGFPARPIPKL
ncbi:MAG: UDP-3-O-(3-hydroxymyristoyl)glucosamine N-acyltransferase, partial [Verrucomicrobiota bacterium]